MKDRRGIQRHCSGYCGKYQEVCCFDCPNYEICRLEDKCNKEEVIKREQSHEFCSGHIEVAYLNLQEKQLKERKENG
jgi:hypothetical protein